MPIYTSTPAPAGVGIPTTLMAICFSGTAATVFKWLIRPGLFLFGAGAGAGIGFLLSLITGPEVITKAVGAFIGAIVGAFAGTAYGMALTTLGACTCPAGREAFCIFACAGRLYDHGSSWSSLRAALKPQPKGVLDLD